MQETVCFCLKTNKQREKISLKIYCYRYIEPMLTGNDKSLFYILKNCEICFLPIMLRLTPKSYYDKSYPMFCKCWEKSRISPHSWCSLNIFCRVCCLAQVPQNGSGSSQVLQKWVAFTWTFSFEHGLHPISFSCSDPVLK